MYNMRYMPVSYNMSYTYTLYALVYLYTHIITIIMQAYNFSNKLMT